MRVFLGALGALSLLCSPAGAAQAEEGFVESFQSALVSEDGVLTSSIGRFVVEGEGALEIMRPKVWEEGELGLRLPGGDRKSTVLEIAPSCAFGGTLEFRCQRDGRKRPFAFEVSVLGRDGTEVSRDLTGHINAKELNDVSIEVPAGAVQIRFSVTAPLTRGVWIDDVRLVPPMPMRLESALLKLHTRPLIHGESVQVGVLELMTVGGLDPLVLTNVSLKEHATLAAEDEVSDREAPALLTAFAIGDRSLEAEALQLTSGFSQIPLFATIDLWGGESKAAQWSASARYSLAFELGGEAMTLGPEETAGETAEETAEETADETDVPASWPAVRVISQDAEIDGVSMVTVLAKNERKEVLVAAISTKAGVVLKRSSDGGESWSSGVLGGAAAELREASLVYDIGRDRLHMLAEKGAGMTHAFSDDAGLTWSELTVLGGLGPKRIGGAASSGIYMSTAELAVPCIYYGGFRIEDEPCAGLIVSRDGGKTWETQNAAYANTSTSAVVEIGPGALLLNMTDGRGALRSERSTRDLGATWARRSRVSLENLHRSAGGDGAMIHLGRARGEGWDGRLVFANAQTERRPIRNMTLKGSSDNVSSWPRKHRVLLDDGIDVDHPSLAPVGDSEVGVLYTPSGGGVVFQRLPESVVVPKAASWFDVTGGR